MKLKLFKLNIYKKGNKQMTDNELNNSNTISRNEDLDLTSMLNAVKEESNVVKSENTPAEVKKSPLEMLKEDEAKTPKGLVVDNGELKADNGPQKNIVYNDERMSDIKNEINNYDTTLNKRSKVTLIKKPMTQLEYVQLMDEIESVKINPDGSVSFDLMDKYGNKQEPVFIRPRKDDEPIFDFSILTPEERKELKDKGTDIKEEEIKVDEDKASESEEENKEDEISPEKKRIVEILIDKTGLGGDFFLTEEEKNKVSEAETIRINEVRILDLATIKAKRSSVSFQDHIKEFNINGSRTTICFPASGFKAQMKGLSYGEYADIALSMENVKFDQYYKRLSIIYNHMTNISRGDFKDFEDFLKHFSYTDISLALYGLYISTEKETQEIPLRCGNKECGKTFNWEYNTRNILRLERCADKFLKKMEEVATAKPSDYDKIAENAAVNNSKYVELPDSKVVCEMGVASAYDFLYNFIPLMNEETFKDAFGNDASQVYMDNVLLLTSVRSVDVPDGEGGYIHCTGYKDILDAIYYIGPNDIKYLAAQTAKIQSLWEVTYSLGDTKCPHCGAVTKNLDVSMDDLVFQTYNRLMSTEIELSKIQEL
jgi:hypothetical protein